MNRLESRSARMLGRAVAWTLAFGVLPVASLGSVGCTTTSEAQSSVVSDEDTKEENTHTYGVIEDDLQAYQWTGDRYEDPRFGGELDNSPTKIENGRPFASENSDTRGSIKEKSRMKMTKASKRTKASRSDQSKKSKRAAR